MLVTSKETKDTAMRADKYCNLQMLSKKLSEKKPKCS